MFISSSRAAWHWHTIPLRCRMGTWIIFFSYLQMTPLTKRKRAYFSFESNFLANICGAQTLSNPHLFMFTKPKTFRNGKYTKIGDPSAYIGTRALSCKWAETFKQLQDRRAINTRPLFYPGVSFHSCLHYHVWLMQTEHLFMHLCIRPVRHLRCDCTQGKFGNVTVSL